MGVARHVVPYVLLLVAVLVQVSIVQQIELLRTSPDIVVLVVVSLALLTNSVSGAAFGFVGGLALELFSALTLGPHAIVGTVLGYWAGRWGEVLVTDEHPVPPLVSGVCATFVLHLGVPLVLFLMSSASNVHGVWGHALMATLLNVVLVVPVYLAVRRVLRSGLLYRPGDVVVD